MIRTQGTDATMSMEVLRYGANELYAGQLNGAPLAPKTSFAREFEDDVSGGDSDALGDEYTDFVSISDDSGSIKVSVPAEWSDVDSASKESFGPNIYAAPDLDAFGDTFETPGVSITATSERTAADIDMTLDELDFSNNCTYVGRRPYSDVLYAGSFDEYSNCGGVDTSMFLVAVAPEDGSFLARVLIQAREP